MLSVDLSVSKLPSSLQLCELDCSVFPLPAFLPFPQRPLVDNIQSGQEDAAEERGPVSRINSGSWMDQFSNMIEYFEKLFQDLCGTLIESHWNCPKCNISNVLKLIDSEH